MDDHELATKFQQDHFTATAALIALMLKNLPDDVRTRTFDAMRNGTGKVELRTRVESSETELVLVPRDGSAPLWLARTEYAVISTFFRVAAFVSVVCSSSSAFAVFGVPYVTPEHPTTSDTVSLNIFQGGCDGVTGPEAPTVTLEGNHVYVLGQGVRYTNPELCTLTPGIAMWPIGSYSAGNYTLQLDLRYPTIGGDFVTETLGVVDFDVAGATQAISAPALSPALLVALILLIASLGARAAAKS
jgi:hypothetical protein